MKRLLLVSCAVVLSACSMISTKMEPVAVAPIQPVETRLLDANGVAIERIPFRPGVSSVTVERLAAAQSCRGGDGAALVTPVGPVEVYRMRCEDGRVFMARCEMRQCKQM